MKTLLTLATCLFCFQSSSLVRLETSEELLKRLNDKIVSLLVTVEKPDYHPPTDWRRLKNLYPSWIHMYMHGNPMVTELRRRLQVYDNNAFATAWITVQLVEAAIYGGYEDIDPDQILAGIQGVDQFRDRNRPEAGSSVVTFWKQVTDNVFVIETYRSNHRLFFLHRNSMQPRTFGLKLMKTCSGS